MAANEFLEAVDWVLLGVIKGAVPRTQIAINAEAGDQLKVVQNEMDALTESVRERNDIDISLFEDSQKKWEIYANSECNFRASLVLGGSMYPLIWATARIEEIERRNINLRWWVNRSEGDL